MHAFITYYFNLLYCTLLTTGICTIIIRDAPDIRPENPPFYIQYPAGYQI
jgi:hypothetical protein